MATRTETRVARCVGETGCRIIVHVPADLNDRADEFAGAIAELLTTLTQGENDE